MNLDQLICCKSALTHQLHIYPDRGYTYQNGIFWTSDREFPSIYFILSKITLPDIIMSIYQ